MIGFSGKDVFVQLIAIQDANKIDQEYQGTDPHSYRYIGDDFRSTVRVKVIRWKQ